MENNGIFLHFWGFEPLQEKMFQNSVLPSEHFAILVIEKKALAKNYK